MSRSEYKKKYEDAYAIYSGGDYESSLKMFDALLSSGTVNDLSDNAQYWVGEIYYALKDYQSAISAFSKVFNYEDNNKGAYAQYKLGLSYLYLNDIDSAVLAFEKVVRNYSNDANLVKKSQKLIDKYK